MGRLAVLYISVFDFDRICVTRVSDDCVNCVCLVAVEITGHCGISDETERRLWPFNANVNYGNGVNIGY